MRFQSRQYIVKISAYQYEAERYTTGSIMTNVDKIKDKFNDNNNNQFI